jgi:hypothetical protein
MIDSLTLLRFGATSEDRARTVLGAMGRHLESRNNTSLDFHGAELA